MAFVQPCWRPCNTQLMHCRKNALYLVLNANLNVSTFDDSILNCIWYGKTSDKKYVELCYYPKHASISPNSYFSIVFLSRTIQESLRVIHIYSFGRRNCWQMNELNGIAVFMNKQTKCPLVQIQYHSPALHAVTQYKWIPDKHLNIIHCDGRNAFDMKGLSLWLVSNLKLLGHLKNDYVIWVT